LQRVLTLYTIPSLLKIPIGFIQSFFLLLTYKPDVVLSFGGYISVPVVFSAWLLSIPIITHEQTIVRGLSYKITSLFANKMAVSFKTGLVGERTIVTGNPMRAGILKSTLPSYKIKRLFQKARQQKKPVIFITGGNQGSHIINQTVLEALPALTLKAVIVLQTGDSKFHDFEDAKSKQCEELLTEKWIETQDFGYILKHAHLVVGRSGINTLLECAMFGTPALLIPYPYLQGDEQMVNARFFESLGLAKILPQKDLNSETLMRQRDWPRKHYFLRRRLMNKFVIIFLLLTLTLSLVIWQLGILNIQEIHITIKDDSCIVPDGTKNQIKVMGQNILFVDKKDILLNLQRVIPCIKDITISPEFPGKLRISIIPRVPMAVVQSFRPVISPDIKTLEASQSSSSALIDTSPPQPSGKVFLADNDGFLFGSYVKEDIIPNLFIEEQDLKINMQLNTRNFNIIGQAFKLLNSSLVLNDINLTNTKLAGQSLIIFAQYKVILSLQKDIPLQLASLQLITEKAKIDGRLLEVVDTRFNKPVVVYAPKK